MMIKKLFTLFLTVLTMLAVGSQIIHAATSTLKITQGVYVENQNPIYEGEPNNFNFWFEIKNTGSNNIYYDSLCVAVHDQYGNFLRNLHCTGPFWINAGATKIIRQDPSTITEPAGDYRLYAKVNYLGSWYDISPYSSGQNNPVGFKVVKKVTPPPTGITASDGSYTNRITVQWNYVSGATHYCVYRNTSNNSGGASPVSSWQVGLTYNDPDYKTTPCQTYYYWVKAATSSSGANASDYSSSDPGWRGLPTPINVQATDGNYTDRIGITWNSVTGASYYRVYRNTSNNSTSAVAIGNWQSSLNYNDYNVTPNQTYYYWVKASTTSSDYRTSAFSSSDTGYANKTDPPTITLTAPNSGSFQIGEQMNITWGSTNQHHFGLYLLKAGVEVATIYQTGSDSSSRSYQWTIPTSINGHTINGTNYKIGVTVWDSAGTSAEDQSNSNISITPKSNPTADFYGTPTSGDTPLTVKFTDQSLPGTGASITNWYWEFGDGGTNSSKDPSHTYNSPGSYIVKLTVTNSFGNTHTESKSNYINVTEPTSNPQANFSASPTSGKAPLTVKFTDLSSPGTGASLTNWYWEFGDGGTSSSKDPSHTYNSQGTYTVKLTVTDSFGNTNTQTRSNYIKTCNDCSGYRLPFPKGETMQITCYYGECGTHTNANNDYYCVDFNKAGDSDAGVPVLAIADGVVTSAGWAGLYGYRVEIDHGNGITSNYSHGASINVKKDDYVRQGQELMVLWDTGNASGPHLHFGMRKNGKSMLLPQFSGCTSGCSFDNLEANGYTSNNTINNPGTIIEENQADKSGSFDKNESYFGHNCKYSWNYAKNGTSTITVTYRPRFSTKVSCDIFVYIPPFNATATAVKYKVKHVGGTETFTVNQLNVPADSSKPDNWVRLGNKAFEFGAGASYYVQVGNGVDNYNKDQKVGFDAVYFKIKESGGGGGTPKIDLNRTSFNFGAIASGPTSDSETLFINNTGKGTLNWTASSNASWLNIFPNSGTNSGIVNISVNSTGLSAGTYSGKITISDSNASNSPRTVSVNLKVHQWGRTISPFGDFSTPTDPSTVRSSVPVTGWALDDVGIASVKIYNGNNYIGDAVFVDGARPDVEQAYPGYPMNSKAGWGYMMLTNFLPRGGNGKYVIYAKVTDKEGNRVTLGSKTIYCDNANTYKPFGAIDTPSQGGAASGRSFINWGWVLTPQPNYIPTNGSTINVYVDGVNIGHPLYNIYREDIANLFPGYVNSYGATGYYTLDTAVYKNGVHTIQWVATDNAGRTDGIGSRYFTIQNTGTNGQLSLSNDQRTSINESVEKRISSIPINNFGPVIIEKGCNLDTVLQEIYPDENCNLDIEIKELERVKIDLGYPQWNGYQLIGDQLRPLPVGSTLDTERGIFYWQPGPGFIGDYQLVFISREEDGDLMKKTVKVNITPKFLK